MKRPGREQPRSPGVEIRAVNVHPLYGRYVEASRVFPRLAFDLEVWLVGLRCIEEAMMQTAAGLSRYQEHRLRANPPHRLGNGAPERFLLDPARHGHALTRTTSEKPPDAVGSAPARHFGYDFDEIGRLQLHRRIDEFTLTD